MDTNRNGSMPLSAEKESLRICLQNVYVEIPSKQYMNTQQYLQKTTAMAHETYQYSYQHQRMIPTPISHVRERATHPLYLGNTRRNYSLTALFVFYTPFLPSLMQYWHECYKYRSNMKLSRYLVENSILPRQAPLIPLPACNVLSYVYIRAACFQQTPLFSGLMIMRS